MKQQEKVNILMVDDQPGKLLSYEVILKELNENLIKAHSGRVARSFAQNRHCRGADGREHARARWLRAGGHDPATPAISANRNYFYLRGTFDRPRSTQGLRTRGGRLYFSADRA